MNPITLLVTVVFGVIGALLFIAGFIVALRHFRQAGHSLALIWIGAMLIPTLVTSGAPNFTRTLGALPMVFALPGLAVEWLSFKLAKVASLRPIFALGLIGVFGMNAASTYDDYFNQWPNHSETQFVFQSDFAAIARDIDASDVMDVSVGGLSNDTLDDPSLYLLRRRKDVRVRWFDSGSPISSGGALLEPFTPGHVYFPSIVPISKALTGGFDPRQDESKSTRFSRYSQATSTTGAAEPREFDDTARLMLSAGRLPTTTIIAAGDRLQFVTRWIAKRPIAYPRRIFVHLVDPQTGQIMAQHDGLDSPTKFWREGDQILQVHRLPIPADASPGHYELWIGLYDPTTGKRVLQTNTRHSESPSDHYVLGTVEVIPDQ